MLSKAGLLLLSSYLSTPIKSGEEQTDPSIGFCIEFLMEQIGKQL
jgi:hypothetical protein